MVAETTRARPNTAPHSPLRRAAGGPPAAGIREARAVAGPVAAIRDLTPVAAMMILQRPSRPRIRHPHLRLPHPFQMMTRSAMMMTTGPPRGPMTAMKTAIDGRLL